MYCYYVFMKTICIYCKIVLPLPRIIKTTAIMLKKLLPVFLCFIGVWFADCSGLSQPDVPIKGDEPSVIIPDEPEIEGYTDDTEIKLGDVRKNPYNIDIMRDAFDILMHTSILDEAVNIPTEPHVNHIYYRVLPTDSMELECLLADTGVHYLNIPLDCDIVQSGAFYRDEDVKDSPYVWLYTVVSARKSLPTVGKVEILDQLFIPAEREDVKEGETDGVGVLEYVAYKLTYNLSDWEDEDIAYYEDLLARYNLSDIGEKPTIKKAMASTDARKAPKRWFSKAYPTGIFSVWNTYTHTWDGIAGAEVIIHNFVKMYTGALDREGKYTSSKVFRTKVYYWIRFYNVPTQTSIFPKVPLIGSALHPLRKHSKEGFDYHCEHNSVAWRYATINNAVVKNARFNYEYEIPTANGLRIWVLPGNKEWSGSTPLLHFARGGYHSVLDLLLFLCGVPYAIPITPDMMIFATQGDETTEELQGTMYHELAHVGHYLRVGDTYWDHYITHIIWHGGYGNDKSGLYAGYCGIGEMWGEYAGKFYLAKDISITELNTIEKVARNGHWYNPPIMAAIGDYAISEGYTFGDLYHVLNADIHSLDALRDGMVRLGLDEKKIDSIIEERKGWEVAK